MFGCGYGEYGQLGLGDTKTLTSFTKILSLSKVKVKHIVAGGHHSVVLLDLENPKKDEEIEGLLNMDATDELELLADPIEDDIGTSDNISLFT